MSTILMPINPKYVDEILSRKKKYEYRTIMPKKDINKMVIYSTYPIKKVVAEVEILEVLVDTPKNIWDKTKNYSGISKTSYYEYYKNKKNAIAYKLGNILIYDNPKDLVDIGINYIPQLFTYLD